MSVAQVLGRVFGLSAASRKPRKNRTIVLAWELGRGMGHANRLVPLAAALTQQGYRIAFVFCSQTDAKVVTDSLPKAPVYKAPTYYPDPTAEPPRGMTANYADILYRCGYATAESLRDLVHRWRALIDDLQPALIVCDHSPTVLLAGAGRVPVIHVASGFASPPAGVPFVTLFPPSLPGAPEREAAVLASLQQVSAELGLKPFTHPSDIFGLGECFACCLPELDPYRRVRNPPAAGPVHTLPKPCGDGGREFVFGYLAGDEPRVLPVLQSLAAAKVPCSLFVRNAPLEWEEQFGGTSLRFFDVPQQLPEVLAVSSAVLHHGGITTSETALAMGRPQLLLPRYLEQGLTADQIQAAGCGLNLRRQKGDLGTVVAQAIRHEALHHRTAAKAAEIGARPSEKVAERILERCLALAQ
jgi:rhamnosyltransferase subunit B